MALRWDSSLVELPSIGDKTAAVLQKAGLQTIGDLLNYFPSRFEDTRNILTIRKLWEFMQQQGLPAVVDKTIVIQGTLRDIKLIRIRGKRLTIVQAKGIDSQHEDVEPLPISWFNQPFIATSYSDDDQVIMKGQLKQDKKKFIFYPTDVERYYPGKKLVHMGRLAPVYRQVAGISTKLFRRWQLHAVEQVQIDDPLPTTWREKGSFVSIEDAYRMIHNPQAWPDVSQSLSRLALQELLELHASFRVLRAEEAKNPITLEPDRQAVDAFIAQLPFTLTKDQRTIYEHWITELQQQRIIDSLICGDVGSGKTIAVFTLAALVLLAGYSVVVIAPTGILAQQHIATMSEWLAGIPALSTIPVQQVTARTRKQAITDTQSVLVGTQALLHRQALPSSVGLVIVDEQHKFGVDQRKQLLELISPVPKGSVPHVVTLSATPIPRTMALHVYGYQSALYIDTPPSKRLPVKTHLVPPAKQDDLFAWIAQQCTEKGTQVFMVYPLVQENSELGIVSAEEAFTIVQERFPQLRVGLLHGKLSVVDKEAVITAFRNKEYDIVVTTTVIEVGIDIPNANIMVIQYPERYGLAQLHQLRGRVGRGQEQGYCYLPLRDQLTPSQRDRLLYFASHRSGWRIAEYDLKHRGSGELYGQLQAGTSELRLSGAYNASLIEQSIALWQSMASKASPLPQRFFLPEIIK